MRKTEFDKLKEWFDSYVESFYGDDKYVNANLALKQEHSYRLCEEISYLVDDLNLEQDQAVLAEAIALLHDIGRFPQFVKYRTYNDTRSVSHAGLGLKVLRREGVFDRFAPEEAKTVEKAIAWHAKKKLPDHLKDPGRLFAKLLRDADKLDIFRVVTSYHIKYHTDPENFELELEFPDTPGYTPQVVEGILKGERIDYSMLRNLNDMKLLQVGWVYDINFPAALRRIRDKGYLDIMFQFMPEIPETEKIKAVIYDYVESRISQAGSKAG